VSTAPFTSVAGCQPSQVSRLLLTASAPFLPIQQGTTGRRDAEQALITDLADGPENHDRLRHLMNKGLEVIEAYHLFGIAADQIVVVILRSPRSTRWWSSWTARRSRR